MYLHLSYLYLAILQFVNGIGENPATMDDNVFLDLGRLVYLDLSNCSIHEMPREFFDGLSSLSELRLSKNPIQEVSILHLV